MRRLLITAAFAIPLAAHAETKTVSWFAAHPEVRAKVTNACRENPGEARHIANCINADAAEIPALADEIPTGNGVLIEDCAKMGRLFQAAAHCGAFAGR